MKLFSIKSMYNYLQKCSSFIKKLKMADTKLYIFAMLRWSYFQNIYLDLLCQDYLHCMCNVNNECNKKWKNHARRKYLSNYIFNFLWMHDWIVKMCFYTDIMQTVNRYVKYYRIGIKKLQGMICHKHFCRYLISILTYELTLKSIYIEIWRLLSLKYCKRQHPLIITFIFAVEFVGVYTVLGRTKR